MATIFSVTDLWGVEIALSDEGWQRIVEKRPDVRPYQDEVRQTLETPNVVYEGRWPDTKVFYRSDLLGSPFWGCYVAVAVRYSDQPPTIRTIYFPFNIEAKLGKLLHFDR